MTRIAEFQKKYPSIPKEVIVKWDVLNRGVSDTEDLDKVCAWQKAGAHYSYQSYDHNITLKEWVDKRPSRLKDGRILRAGKLMMKNGVGAAIHIDTRSPYQIKDLGNGNFGLFEGEEKVDVDVFFPHPKPRSTGELLTSNGTPVSNFVSQKRRCFSIMPVRYCEYFATGEQCKFCNFNVTQEDSGAIGLNRPVTISLDDTVDAYKVLSSDTRLLEGELEMGGFMKSENEGRIYFDFVEKLANAASYKPNLGCRTQAMDRKDMQRLKDAGLDSMSIQLEVWDPRLFSEILPGKSKHASHERWLEAFTDAVDVFGAGNVGGKIIAGLSMIPANGHQTWQEARDSHIEGNTWMIKNGVMPVFTNLRLPPGSVYGQDQANWERLPPTEYHLDVALAHHKSMLDYGLYDKLNKFLYCALCCITSPYAGELGMLAKAGDIGSWMGPVVPEDANWLAQFIASTKSPVGTQEVG